MTTHERIAIECRLRLLADLIEAQELQCGIREQMEDWGNGIKRMVTRGPDGRFGSSSTTAQSPPAPTDVDKVVSESSSTGGKGSQPSKKYDVAKPEKIETPSFINDKTSESVSKMSKEEAESADATYDSKDFKDSTAKVGGDLDSKAKKGNPFQSIMDAFSGARDKAAEIGGAAVKKIGDGISAAGNMAKSVYEEAKENGDVYGEIASVAAMAFIQAPAGLGGEAKELLQKETDAAIKSIQSRYMEKQDSDKLLKRQANPEKERQKIMDELKAVQEKAQKEIQTNKNQDKPKPKTDDKRRSEIDDLVSKSSSSGGRKE